MKNIGLQRLFLGDLIRDMKLILFSLAFRRIVMGFLQVVRAIYFSLIGFDPATIGILLSIPMFVGAARSVLIGLFSDKYGRKPFLLAGCFFSSLRLAIYATYGDFWMMAFAQCLGALGEGGGAGQPAVSGFIADKTEAHERSEIFNTIAISNGVTATLGSLLAGLPAYVQPKLGLEEIEACRISFWLMAVLNLISLLLVFPLKEEMAERETLRKNIWPEKSLRVIWRFSLVRSTGGLGFSFIDSLMPLYFYLKFGVGSDILGPLYAVSRFLTIISYSAVPTAVHKLGEIKTIITTRITICIISFLFPIVPFFEITAILFIAFRTLAMFTMPVRQTFATELAEPSETASVIGISNSTRMGIRTLAPALTGYMFQIAQFTGPFLIGGILLAVNASLYETFFSRNKSE